MTQLLHIGPSQVNIPRVGGMSPLSVAALFGFPDLIPLLVDCGANVDQQDEMVRTLPSDCNATICNWCVMCVVCLFCHRGSPLSMPSHTERRGTHPVL